MNDKLHLHLPIGEYQIRAGHQLDWRQTHNCIGGVETRNVKYWKNGIGGTTTSLDINHKGLILELNPNKLQNIPIGDNSFNGDIISILDSASEQVNRLGVDADFRRSTVRTYHQSFDISPELDYYSYYPLLKTIAPLDNLRDRKYEFRDSIYFGNDSTVNVIYNKKIESSLKIPMIRFEHRKNKLKGSKIFKGVPAGSISPDFYNTVRNNDKSVFLKKIFTLSPDILDSDHLAYFQFLLENENNRRTIDHLFTLHVLSGIRLKSGKGIADLLQIGREDAKYKKFLSYRKDIASHKKIENVYRERFSELSELFGKVA